MKPFRRLRRLGNQHDRTSSVVASTTSKRHDPGGSSALSWRGRGLTPSADSSRRSRSVERREDSSSRRSRSRSRSEKRQGGDAKWYERLGGSVVSQSGGGRRSKSVDRNIGGSTASRSRKSRSRSRQRSHSRERPTSRSRSYTKSYYEIANGRSCQSSGTNKSAVTPDSSTDNYYHHKRTRSLDHPPLKLSDQGKRSSSKSAKSGSRKCPMPLDDEQPSRGPSSGGEKRISSQHGVVSEPGTRKLELRKRSRSLPRASEVHGTSEKDSPPPLKGNETPPRLPSKVAGSSTSAFQPTPKMVSTQRWPRLHFRRKKAIEDAANEFKLDPEQRQRLLTMILGNNGSMFDEKSTLGAPRGQVMRDPMQRIPKEIGSAKTCGEHLVDLALLFEAISASPFICIQTICCVQEDYLEEERNKLARAEAAVILAPKVKSNKAKRSNPGGPPEVIQVVPTHTTPKRIAVRHDAPSVSVFTQGTSASNAGFWLPFGLGQCKDSVADEREYARAVARELQRSVSDSPITTELGTPTRELLATTNFHAPDSSIKAVVEEISLNMEKSTLSEKKWAPSRKVKATTRLPTKSSSHSSTDDRPITNNSSKDGSTDEEPVVSPAAVKIDPLPSLADDEDDDEVKDKSSCAAPHVSPNQQLDEWEAMEAKLKAALNQVATEEDDTDIKSL